MKTIKGGCLCGRVRFEYRGDLGAASYCHCEDCRRCTGSAYGVSVAVDVARFSLLAGELSTFTKCGDSGRELTRHFCGGCGSPIYTSSPLHPGQVYVKGGVFDQPELVRPGHQSWCGSAVSWSTIDGDLPRFEKSRR